MLWIKSDMGWASSTLAPASDNILPHQLLWLVMPQNPGESMILH